MERATWILFAVLLFLAAAPHSTHADPERPFGSDYTTGENKGQSSFTATISTSGRGVRVEVRGRQQLPGRDVPPGDTGNAVTSSPNAVANRSNSAGQAPRGNVAATGQRWYDPARGYFWAAPDGHLYSVEGMNIGRSPTLNDRSTRPGSVPMVFNVDGQFQGIVWLPTT